MMYILKWIFEWVFFTAKGALNNSSCQAKFAVLDAVQGAKHSRSGLRRAFATPQCAKIREFLRHEELFSASLTTSGSPSPHALWWRCSCSLGF